MGASFGWRYIRFVYLINTLPTQLMVQQYNVSVVVSFVRGKFITDPNVLTYTIWNAWSLDMSVISVNLKTQGTCISGIVTFSRRSAYRFI
jgi:hypothetical protein